jgi:hypothetical protein
MTDLLVPYWDHNQQRLIGLDYRDQENQGETNSKEEINRFR